MNPPTNPMAMFDLPHPLTVAFLVPADHVMKAEEYEQLRQALIGVLQVKPDQLVLRAVPRGHSDLAPHDGFPELGAVMRLGARLVLQCPKMPWDEWLAERGVPMLPYPFEPSPATQQALRIARDETWVTPRLGGSVLKRLGGASRVTIVGPGCAVKEDDGLSIGLSALQLVARPATPDFAVVSRTPFLTPVDSREVSAVGMRVDAMLDGNMPVVPFSLSVGLDLMPRGDAKLTDAERAELSRRQTLHAATRRVVLERGISRVTLMDPLPPEPRRPESLLWSPYRMCLGPLGRISTPEAVLVASIRRAGFKGPIVVREHDRSLRLIRGHQAMERLAMEEKAGPLTWDRATDEDPAPAADPLLIILPTEDLTLTEGTKRLIEWLQLERRGAIDRTFVAAKNAAIRAAFPVPGSDALDLPCVTIKPWALVPLPEM